MTKTNIEIDLVIVTPKKETIFIEIKSKDVVSEVDCKALQAFVDTDSKIKAFLFSTDPVSKKIGSVHCMSWQKGLAELGLA